MEVAIEVQVDLLLRVERGLAAAGGTSLLSEHRSEGGLAQCRHGVMPAFHESLSQSNGRDRLAFATRRRRHRGDEDELAASRRESLQQLEPHLRRVFPVRLE